MQPITKCGPKGISVSRFFDFLIKLGKEKPKAVRDEKINIKGIEIQPNQKPKADKSFASPKPIPSLFLSFL